MAKVFNKTKETLVIFSILAQCILGIPTGGLGAGIGVGTYSAGIIGNFAGHLTSGKAISQLHTDAISSNDYSEGAAKNSASLYETLGSLGDHLDEHNFPKDYDEHSIHHDAGSEAQFVDAEVEAASSNSEHHFDLGSYGDEGHDHLGFSEIEAHGDLKHADFGGDVNHEIHSKAVPGINHGKGAFSYSTSYEFKDKDNKEFQL